MIRRFLIWVNTRIKTLNWFDIKLISIGCFLLGWALGKFLAAELTPLFFLLIAGSIICLIRPYSKLLFD